MQKSRNNRKYNSRKPKFSKESKDSENKRDYKSEKANDPSWYIRENQLAKDVASLSFNNALGARTYLNGDNAFGNLTFTNYDMSVPGIMAIHTIPAAGISISADSPINLAAKNLYAWVRHENSGHANYDSPDLMMYIMAMDSIYAYIAFLQRIYGIARVYSQKNRYFGDGLLVANRINANDIRANMANLRAYINMLIVKASAFNTPISMSLYKRHMWMYSTVFSDSEIEKAQMYMYIPSYLWKYDEYNGAGRLVPTSVCDTLDTTNNIVTYKSLQTYSQLTVIGDQLIGALTGSEDINIMSGDILKAYGRENIWKLALVNEDYAVVPVYSEEILDQIHNTNFVGDKPRTVLDLTDSSQCNTVDINRWYLQQDPNIGQGAIGFAPQFAGCAYISSEKILDMFEGEPSPERVLVGSRNMLTGSTGYDNTVAVPITTLDSCGSDIALFASLYRYVGGTLVNTRNYNSGSASATLFAIQSKFNRSPLFYVWAISLGQASVTDIFGEMGNFTVVDRDDIDKMHQSAILSMLGVPVYREG